MFLKAELDRICVFPQGRKLCFSEEKLDRILPAEKDEKGQHLPALSFVAVSIWDCDKAVTKSVDDKLKAVCDLKL